MEICVREVKNGADTGHVTFKEGVVTRPDTAVTFADVLDEKVGHVPTNHSSCLDATVSTSNYAYHVNGNLVVDSSTDLVTKNDIKAHLSEETTGKPPVSEVTFSNTD